MSFSKSHPGFTIPDASPTRRSLLPLRERLGAGNAEIAVLGTAVAGLVAAGFPLARDGAWASVGLLVVAAALGWVFFSAQFGYTSAFRAWLARGDGSGLAAGLLVPAVAALVIVPFAALVPGYSGFVSPIGVPLVIGAAVFGLGMQLGNGCGSGTLYAAGSGSRRMWVVLPFFCLGGVLGSLVLPSALRLPSLGAVGLGGWLGPWAELRRDADRHRGARGLRARIRPAPECCEAARSSAHRRPRRSDFPPLAPAVGRHDGFDGVGCQGTLGRGVRSRTHGVLGLGRTEAVAGRFHPASDSSLMNIGMILGATAASGWRGSFRPQGWPPRRGLIVAALGGLLMGIGARLAFGCNIGGLVGGIQLGQLARVCLVRSRPPWMLAGNAAPPAVRAFGGLKLASHPASREPNLMQGRSTVL